jgi:hypothetical protein
LIQSTVGPAAYYHNPKSEKSYLSSAWLPIINNEKSSVNKAFKNNFLKLEKVVLAMFTYDAMVDPPSSAWFDFYGSDGKTIVPYTS